MTDDEGLAEEAKVQCSMTVLDRNYPSNERRCEKVGKYRLNGNAYCWRHLPAKIRHRYQPEGPKP